MIQKVLEILYTQSKFNDRGFRYFVSKTTFVTKLIMKLLYTLIITFFSVISYSQIVTDRPDQTESSSTVGLGNLQIESGILVQYEDVNQFRQILAPTSLFRYGLTEGVELRLLSQLESNRFGDFSIDGISDLQIGTKIQILKGEGRNTEIAFISHIIIPSGTAGLSTDELGTINKLSIAHSLGDRISLGYNIGYDHIDSGNAITYSIAFGFGINDKFGMYAEPFGSWEEDDDFDHNFDAGITYLVNDNCQLDFSFGTGITNNMNYISVGGSWLIQRNSDSE